MKGFIEIKTSGGNRMFVNVSAITSVKQCKGHTEIYIIGNADKYYLTDESYNTVVNKIKFALEDK